MYDLDGDGCIVKDELMAILRARSDALSTSNFPSLPSLV